MCSVNNGTFELVRTVQCAKCPWKVSTNPHNIPDGYSVEKHQELRNTIRPGIENYDPKELPIMACHHSDGEDEMYCVGWLFNQMGDGNNIGLRLKMYNCTNVKQIKLKGKQHADFEDTLPK